MKFPKITCTEEKTGERYKGLEIVKMSWSNGNTSYKAIDEYGCMIAGAPSLEETKKRADEALKPMYERDEAVALVAEKRAEWKEMIEKLTPEEKAAAAKELAELYGKYSCCAYCVFVNTLRNSIGDCTNGGETAKIDRFVLYTHRMSRAAVLLDAKRRNLQPSEVLHACRNEVCGEYVADVITRPHAWHMAGGNFVFSPDARYREVTGIGYPISVHDRVEA